MDDEILQNITINTYEVNEIGGEIWSAANAVRTDFNEELMNKLHSGLVKIHSLLYTSCNAVFFEKFSFIIYFTLTYRNHIKLEFPLMTAMLGYYKILHSVNHEVTGKFLSLIPQSTMQCIY